MKANKILFVIVIVSFIACKKTPTQGPPGAQGSAGQNGNSLAPGSIIGFLNFYDQFGVKQQSDTSVVANIAGTNITAKVDTNGRYILKNVPGGVYNIFFQSANYSKGGLVGVSFAGNGSLYVPSTSVSKPPSFLLTFAGASASGNVVNLIYNVNSSYNAQRKLAIYADANNGVSSDPQHFKLSTNGFITANQTTYTLTLGTNLFTSGGFSSGQSVFLKLYPISSNGFITSTYQDTLTGKPIYNALNLTGAVTATFVMP